MTTTNLDAVTLPAPGKHTASVIWLHGLGADGHDFEPIVPELRLPAQHGIKFVFPNAPRITVSINNGYVMPAWYDIKSNNLRMYEDEAGIRRSAKLIESFIAQEKALGIPTNKILLAGFSQGGAITLHCGLRYPETLAGLLPLSTYLPLPDSIAKEAHPANKTTPIFMGHGIADHVIPLQQGKNSADTLKRLGYNVDFHEYFMQHAVNPEEIKDIAGWLKQRLV